MREEEFIKSGEEIAESYVPDTELDTEQTNSYEAVATSARKQQYVRAVDNGSVRSDQKVEAVSIRNILRNLPPDRYAQLRSDLVRAVEALDRNDIGIAADAITNWALGGQGYEYAGEVVNNAIDDLPDINDDPDLKAAWEAYKAKV